MVPQERCYYECRDVDNDSVANQAGLRIGDRVDGYNEYYQPGHIKTHVWGDTTLDRLKCKDVGTLVILFVSKQVVLANDEEQRHMKKRMEFISSRKSTLKKHNRMGELPKFVQKWDMNNNLVLSPLKRLKPHLHEEESATSEDGLQLSTEEMPTPDEDSFVKLLRASQPEETLTNLNRSEEPQTADTMMLRTDSTTQSSNSFSRSLENLS
ncbi:hypothetical protein F442_11750 [Phytophthora nicotianae P10297]|uniref:Uncharacterized protein n=1 Tax=Phytophthora nicotianae P10297 TaxID=1317064 RepID=W2Z139_PHYNI|nr:hypothetical protein F442_11750 [Phytophthora nicotianae P10297]